jgi:crossover junction endodeoxyribonuclease RuvC
MFVLGVDPGLSRCGYGCVERTAGRSRAVAAGVLSTPPADPLPRRLAALARDLSDLLDELGPHVVVVERVLFQVNARTAMATGQASGLALATAAQHGAEVVQYSPNEVKLAVAGHGGAGKAQVQRMVQVLLDLAVAPSPPDVADALALALCHIAMAPLAAAAARSTSASHPAAQRPNPGPAR